MSSTHHDSGVDDVDPTMRDSDYNAPLVLTRADMPQSVQDLHEVASDDEGEGHDESFPVFDPDTDDDTDRVIEALQRDDLEGDVIPADTFIQSRFRFCEPGGSVDDVWFLSTVHQFWMRVVAERW